ncbi:MAG: hypothetical protein JOZ54_08540 [Acidobacteria bacterium]|nr:hypothetical protein [Acidobacteriota bacterium]
MRILAVALLSFFALQAFADHAPEWLMSKAKPETTVAGIEVGVSTVADAEKLYGRTYKSKALVEDGTETEYVWQLPLSEIHVTTMHPRDRAVGKQIIYAVEIRQRAGKRSTARTGAGVMMGEDLDSLVRAYGARYMTRWRKLATESEVVTFIFSNETELSVGFSDEGTITSMLLVESQE